MSDWKANVRIHDDGSLIVPHSRDFPMLAHPEFHFMVKRAWLAGAWNLDAVKDFLVFREEMRQQLGPKWWEEKIQLRLPV